MKQVVLFEDLGRMAYQEAWDYQESLLQENLRIKADARQHGTDVDPLQLPTRHHFLFVEHPPVYTLGKSGKMEHLLLTEPQLAAKGIAFVKTNRGGDITFHGPEQIVGYPIFDLEKMRTDIGWYLRQLEEVIIRTIGRFGIKGGRSAGETGVWIDADVPGRERKICAMGVRCSRWITLHGFALNVNTDLTYFDNIIPCGIQNKQVASMEKELGRRLDLAEVKTVLLEEMGELFTLSFEPLAV
ncbi:MAG TPA: lipoyl(octanoyl) transferase LipB [Ferruginibacter sp.]|nr:lipoyl(octanoyl) transferase LipB [Ferruginibacter sp.]